VNRLWLKLGQSGRKGKRRDNVYAFGRLGNQFSFLGFVHGG